MIRGDELIFLSIKISYQNNNKIQFVISMGDYVIEATSQFRDEISAVASMPVEK